MQTFSTNRQNGVITLVTSVLMIVGSIVLIGWFIEYERVVILIDGFPSMKANTAICFILLGTGVFLRLRRKQIGAIVVVIALVLISSFTLIEHIAKVDFGIDQLFVNDHWSSTYPGRMSAGTAIAFMFGGILIFGLNSWPDEHPYLFDIFLLLNLSGPLFAVFAYIYTPGSLFGTRLFSTMALHTAIGFLLFLVGIAFSAGGNCSASMFTRISPGGRRFRFLLPQVLILPLLLGWVLERAIMSQWIVPSLGIPIFSVTVVLIIIVALSWNAQRDDRWNALLEIERQERASIESKMQMVLDVAGDAVLLAAQDGTILHLNSGAEHILGYSAIELKEQHISTLIPPRLRERHEKHVHQFMASPDTSRFQDNPLHMVVLHKNGDELPVMITTTKRKLGSELLVTAIIKDASFVKGQIAALDEKVHFDALTGVRNRRGLETRLNTLKLGQRRKQDGLTVFMVDIDHFKKVNDTWGHDVGDEILKQFVVRVGECLRQTDELYRYGGEEFTVIANILSADEARDLAERICVKVREEPLLTNQDDEVAITCSIGIGVPMVNETSLLPALGRADKCLYQAKADGRNRVVSVI